MASPDITAYWTTSVSDIEDNEVYIRGYNQGELIGRVPFSAATFLLVRGRLPTPGETRMMEAILCAILDYSLGKPGTVAARYCASATPQMVPGMATAVLAVGEYTLAPEDAGRFIGDSFAAYQEARGSMQAFAEKLVDDVRAAKRRIPGFGHPAFRFTDPRAQKLKDIAVEAGVWGQACEFYEAVHTAFTTAVGKPEIVINDVGMLAAIMVQMGFTPPEMTGMAVISSLPGVIAHVSEELSQGQRIRGVPDEIASYARERHDLDADLAEAGW
jgi:citrate synthase